GHEDFSCSCVHIHPIVAVHCTGEHHASSSAQSEDQPRIIGIKLTESTDRIRSPAIHQSPVKMPKTRCSDYIRAPNLGYTDDQGVQCIKSAVNRVSFKVFPVFP
ncbi:unnamed protein product, partial [Sphacelaria rigidula]